jgi:hypothetical protein
MSPNPATITDSPPKNNDAFREQDALFLLACLMTERHSYVSNEDSSVY